MRNFFDRLFSESDTLKVIRKKVLLRILARHEANRIHLPISAEDVQSMIDEFRIQYNLIDAGQMEKWLTSIGLTNEAFINMMYDLTIIKRLEEEYAMDVTKELPNHILLSSIQEKLVSEIFHQNRGKSNSYWAQMNVALERKTGDALPSARALFSRLSPTIARWRKENTLEHFFFIRKPPDVRLRFLVYNPQINLIPDLEKMLAELKQEGLIKYYFPSIYEPEIFQFGGEEAIDLIHAYFDIDSEAWIKLDQLASSKSRTLTSDKLVMAVMNDLFIRTLQCPSEVWDVWCNLERIISSEEEIVFSATEPYLLDSLLSHVSAEEKKILEEYLHANQELSAGLLRVWSSGKLLYGLRSILPFIAMFHFNRHGLDGEKQAVIASSMKEAWNPKRNLRGAQVDSILNTKTASSGSD